MALSIKQDKFLEYYIKSNCHVTRAAIAANISRSTYYEWLDKSDEFRQKRDDAVEGLYDDVEDSLLTLIQAGNVTAIIFFCKTKMKRRGYVESMSFMDDEVAEPVTSIEFVTVDARVDH